MGEQGAVARGVSFMRGGKVPRICVGGLGLEPFGEKLRPGRGTPHPPRIKTATSVGTRYHLSVSVLRFYA